jgi:glutathione synthase/RimK-type ligase-like ATP-grasp enzyme
MRVMSNETTGRVALVTAAAYRGVDEDLPRIAAALIDRGVDAVVADWHDAGFDWAGVDLAVIRSTWDYTAEPDAFLAWVDRVAGVTRLANPAPIVRWNTDKRYLLDLAAAGVPTVPTRIVALGDGAAAGRAVSEVAAVAGGGTVVVKPVVSAGAVDTDRYGPDELAEADSHVERLLAQGRSVIVQPYLLGIDEVGETGLVVLRDAFSHAFGKGPVLASGLRSSERAVGGEAITPRVASAAERALADAALDAVATALPGWSRRDLLIARVDVAPHDDGPVVMELELIEPALFCFVDDGAVDRVADAIAAAVSEPG